MTQTKLGLRRCHMRMAITYMLNSRIGGLDYAYNPGELDEAVAYFKEGDGHQFLIGRLDPSRDKTARDMQLESIAGEWQIHLQTAVKLMLARAIRGVTYTTTSEETEEAVGFFCSGEGEKFLTPEVSKMVQPPQQEMTMKTSKELLYDQHLKVALDSFLHYKMVRKSYAKDDLPPDDMPDRPSQEDVESAVAYFRARAGNYRSCKQLPNTVAGPDPKVDSAIAREGVKTLLPDLGKPLPGKIRPGGEQDMVLFCMSNGKKVGLDPAITLGELSNLSGASLLKPQQ